MGGGAPRKVRKTARIAVIILIKKGPRRVGALQEILTRTRASEQETDADPDAALSREATACAEVIRIGSRRPRIGNRPGRRQAVAGRDDASVSIAQVSGDARACTVLNPVISLVERRDRLTIE